MAAWKIAPALAAGNTVVIKPAETTPLSILVLAEIIADADLPPGVVNILPGAGDIGRALVNHPGIDKVAFTGSTEVGKQIQRSLAGTGRKLTLELGGKAANIVFDDAPIDQAVEGIVNGIFFNQGHVCCAGSRLLVQESVADEVIFKLRERISTLRLGDPMDKNTDIGAINSAEQLARITALTDAGEDEGAEPLDLAVPGARSRLFLRANGFHQRVPVDADRPRGDLRPGAVGADLPHAGRGGRQGQQHPVRPVRRGLDREGFAHPGYGGGAARRRGVGQHVQPVRPDRGLRRLQGVGLRSRGWPIGTGRLSGHRRRGWRSDDRGFDTGRARLAVAKTYKLYIGGAFPAIGIRPDVSGDGRRRHGSWRTPPAASRKDARDAVSAARKAFGGWSGATAYNRGQVIYRIAEMLEGRRAQFVELLDAGGESGRRGGVGRRLDRPTRALRRLDRQAGRGLRRRESGCRAVLLVLHPGADRRRRRRCAAATIRCSAWSVGDRADHHLRQHRRW